MKNTSITLTISQIDQNGVISGQKMGRKGCKNGAFTAVYAIYTGRIVLYSRAPKDGPFRIRIVNGPYLAGIPNFTDKIR